MVVGVSLLQDNDQAAAYIERRSNMKLWGARLAWFIMREGQIMGAVAYDHYRGADIEMNVALDGAITMGDARAVAKLAFVYPFRCARITAHTRPDNVKAIAALRLFGFMYEGLIPDMYGHNEHAVRYGLLKRNQTLIRGIGDGVRV
jgi:ribosomal protein S18 acetylase RimI-like enzyme